MAEETDFSTLLIKFMERNQLKPDRLSKKTAQTGLPGNVPKATIIYWTDPSRKSSARPRDWISVVLVARALNLTETETNKLLQAAGMEPIAELARQAEDEQILGVLNNWNSYLYSGGNTQFILPLVEIEKQAKEKFHPGIQAIRKAEAAGFIGREIELAEYQACLNDRRPAIIVGFPGVGKTLLAAKLASSFAKKGNIPEKNVFWHDFNANHGIDSILYNLAEFLTWHGIDDLRRFWFAPQQTSGKTIPSEEASRYLFQQLPRKRFIICLDDTYQVENDTQIQAFIQDLIKLADTGVITLIIATRGLPNFVKTIDCMPLLGMSRTDSRRLLMAHNVELAEDLVSSLHSATGGNPNFLIHAIDAIKQGKDPAKLVSQLTGVEDIERFLMETVYDSLRESEREVMGAVAVLGEEPGTKEAVEAILERGGVKSDLIRLTGRSLLTAINSAAGKVYEQHATVQAFYYDDLGPQAAAMHARAGAFYETKEPDILKAARHFHLSGNHPHAAQLATADPWQIINRGQARGLQKLLSGLVGKELEPGLKVEVELALGEVLSLMGEDEASLTHFKDASTALDSNAQLPNAHRLRTRACLGAARALEYSAPQEALEWIQRGLDQVSAADAAQTAWLQLKAGSLYIAVGDLEQAMNALRAGMDILPEGEGHIRGGLHLNLGTVYGMKGDLEQAGQEFERAREIYLGLGDRFRLVEVWNNLGMVKDFSGDWAGAVEEYEKALQAAEALGSVHQQARLNNNLGFLRMNQGKDDKAEEHFEKTKKIAHNAGLVELEIISLINQAQLNIRKGAFQLAQASLEQALNLAQEKDAQDQLAEIYRNHAEILLGMGSFTDAYDEIQKALASDEEQDNQLEKGIALRVLGEILISTEQQQEGLNAFMESSKILEEMDPFETARTQLSWGKTLCLSNEKELGKNKLQECLRVFHQLSANREVNIIEKLTGHSL